jgi:hypothetical protein
LQALKDAVVRGVPVLREKMYELVSIEAIKKLVFSREKDGQLPKEPPTADQLAVHAHQLEDIGEVPMSTTSSQPVQSQRKDTMPRGTTSLNTTGQFSRGCPRCNAFHSGPCQALGCISEEPLPEGAREPEALNALINERLASGLTLEQERNVCWKFRRGEPQHSAAGCPYLHDPRPLSVIKINGDRFTGAQTTVSRRPKQQQHQSRFGAYRGATKSVVQRVIGRPRLQQQQQTKQTAMRVLKDGKEKKD